GLEIKREFLNAQGTPVKEVMLGEPVDVVVTMQAHGDAELQNMVLVDLLPGGFEIIPDSVKAPAPASSDENAAASEGEEGEGGGEASDENAAAPANGGDSEENKAAEPEGPQWTPQATDVREDRLLAFGSIPTEATVYRYKIKAVNVGAYVIPPAYSES